MIRAAATIAATFALHGCTSEPIVLENDGRNVVLSGGPGSISSTAEAIDYHQPTADRLCAERGYGQAVSTGEQVDAFIASYRFRCS